MRSRDGTYANLSRYCFVQVRLSMPGIAVARLCIAVAAPATMTDSNAVGASTTPGSITGTIYVADPSNNQVVVFPPSGTTTFFNSLPCPSSVRKSAGTWPLNAPRFVADARE